MYKWSDQGSRPMTNEVWYAIAIHQSVHSGLIEESLAFVMIDRSFVSTKPW